MKLEELKMLGACSLLGARIRSVTTDGGRTWHTANPAPSEIAEAVKVAGQIWIEPKLPEEGKD